MDEGSLDLEEGEIQDDEVDYTPLARPPTYALDVPLRRFPDNNTRDSDSEDDLKPQSSESDSDSDTGLMKTKKPKPKRVKITPKPLQRRQDMVKKYDIWSTRAQEDVLAETMNSCDVTIKDRSRDVETYDFSMARKYYDELEKTQGNKRTRDDRKNLNFKPKKRSNSAEKDVRGSSRIIPDLAVEITSSNEDIAKDMANKLCEEREDLILKAVEVLGKEKMIDIYNETKRIEKEGGMLIMNQTRRRTPGGVFLFLVRQDYHITPEQRQKIFEEEKQKYNKMVKEKKKKKLHLIRLKTEEARKKLLPDLLTRAELFAKDNSTRELKDTDESNCTNPPPSPETDHHESGDGMEPSGHTQLDANNSLEDSRGKLRTYDEDFLDIGCDNNMDLF